MKIKNILSLFLVATMFLLSVGCDNVNKTDSEASGSGSQTASGGNKVIDVMVDWKDLSDPRGKAAVKGTQTGKTNPQIVKTKYKTADVVVADIVPTEMGYAVDPTGKTDSTEGIQQALYDCHDAGGGTVFLPAGIYAVSDTIIIPQYVTLRGDWQNPDEGTEYGTVFCIWMDPADTATGGPFLLNDSSGMVGATVYYPFQTLYEVLPYPFTFYIADVSQVITVKDVTVINGYRGIGTSVQTAHEILIIDNFYGTFLQSGMEINNQSDAGAVDSVYISTKYWKEAAAECMNKPLGSEIDAYVKKNATGLILSDVEWSSFCNINVDGYNIGIKVIPGYRIDLSAPFYNVNIKNCETGIYAQSIATYLGAAISNSYIEGGIINEWTGVLKGTDVEVKGNIDETVENTVILYNDDLSKYVIDYDKSYVKPNSNLVVANLKQSTVDDSSAQLQAAINKAKSLGGGVVYVPGGTYRFDKPITVPAGVELRGATSVSQREIYKADLPGTRFLCYYGDGEKFNPLTDQAFITLEGKNAGVNGIRIVYAKNGPLDENLNTTYTVRGKAEGVYVVNTYICAAAYGIDFRNCDSHYLRGDYTGCYYNTFLVGGKNGVIRNCLQNPTMVTRIQCEALENWGNASRGFTEVTNPITRKYLQNIIVQDAENELIFGILAYGARNLLVNKNSVNTVAINMGSDNMNALGAQYINKDAELTVINTLRYNGHSYDNINGLFRRYTATEGYLPASEKNIVLNERK